MCRLPFHCGIFGSMIVKHEKDLLPEDFKKANEYFTKALKFAKEKNDVDYIERIKEQLEMIKTVI